MAEKPLPFPLRGMYKQRLRRAIPTLLHFSASSGYDVWVYSSSYYSMEYIQNLLRLYGVRFDGILHCNASLFFRFLYRRKRREMA